MSTTQFDLGWYDIPFLPDRGDQIDSGNEPIHADRPAQTSESTSANVDAGTSRIDAVRPSSPVPVDRPTGASLLVNVTSDDHRNLADLNVLTVIFVVWAIGCGVLSLRFGYQCWQLARMCRVLCPISDKHLENILKDVCRVLGLKRRPDLVTISAEIPGPFVTGVRRGLVVVPRSLLGQLDEGQWRDILLHECTHLKHHDRWIGVWHRIVRILYWPHPLVHCLIGHHAQSREEFCDAQVVIYGDPIRFARTLLCLASKRKSLSSPTFTCGILHHNQSAVASRIESLLAERRKPMASSTWKWFSVYAVVFVLCGAGCFGVRVSSAEEKDQSIELKEQGEAVRCSLVPILVSPFASNPLDVAISHDDELIAVVDDLAFVTMFDSRSGRALLRFPALSQAEKEILLRQYREGRIHAAAIKFTPDSHRLAVSCDGVLRFYDPETGFQLDDLVDHRLLQELRKLRFDRPDEIKMMSDVGHAHGRVYDFEFSGDGSTIATVGAHLIRPGGRTIIHADTPTAGMVKTWDLEAGKLNHDLGEHYGSVRSVDISGDVLATIGASKPGWSTGVRLWSLSRGNLISELPIRNGGVFQDALAIAPDGKFVATVAIFRDSDEERVDGNLQRLGLGSCKLLLWDVESGKRLHQQKTEWVIESLQFSSDSEILALATYPNGVTLRNAVTLEDVGRSSLPQGQEMSAHRIALSRTGDLVAAVDGDKQGGILRVWKISYQNAN